MSTSILNLSSNLLITIELFWATTDEENKSMGIPSGGRNQGLLVGFFYTACRPWGPMGVPGVPWHPQVLAEQSTLSQPRGQTMPTKYY